MFLCRNLYAIWSPSKPTISNFSHDTGDLKSSSPSESPLMDKRELRETHCPILKQTSKEAATPADPTHPPATSNPTPSEERRVAFDIGDSEDLDCNKERKVAFDIGDDEDEHCAANGGERKLRICFFL